MGDHSKRTTVLLTVVAILFILTIIILCLPYNIGHQPKHDDPDNAPIYTNKTATDPPKTTDHSTSTTSRTTSTITEDDDDTSSTKSTTTEDSYMTNITDSTTTKDPSMTDITDSTTTDTNRTKSTTTEDPSMTNMTDSTTTKDPSMTYVTDSTTTDTNRTTSTTTENPSMTNFTDSTTTKDPSMTNITDSTTTDTNQTYFTTTEYPYMTNSTDSTSTDNNRTKSTTTEDPSMTSITDSTTTDTNRTNSTTTQDPSMTNITDSTTTDTNKMESTTTENAYMNNSTDSTTTDNNRTKSTTTDRINSTTTQDPSMTDITDSTTTDTTTTKYLANTNSTDSTTTTDLSITNSTESTASYTTTPAVTTEEYVIEQPERNTTRSKDLTSKMWLLRDINTKPCEDFYQYACGGAVDNKYLHTVDARDAIKRKILANIQDGGDEYKIPREFYQSCRKQYPAKAQEEWETTSTWMDQEMPTSTCDPKNLTTIMARLIKNNFSPLFDVSLGLDSGKIVFQVTPPISRSPFSDDITMIHCLKQYKLQIMKEDHIDIEEKFKEYLDCKASGSGMDVRLESLRLNLEHLNIKDDLINDTLDFIEQAAQFKNGYPFSSVDLMQRDYETYKINQMNDELRLSNKINWNDMMSELVGDSVGPETAVQVFKPKYLKSIITFLTIQVAQSKPVCKILLTLWKEARYMDFVKPRTIESSLVPYSKEYCLDLTTSLVPELLYSLNDTQVTADKEKVSEVIEIMRTSLINRRDISVENQELENFHLTQRGSYTFRLLGNIDKHDYQTLNVTSYQKMSLLLLKRIRPALYTELSNNIHDDQHLNWLKYVTFENAAYHPENKYYPASYMEAPYNPEEVLVYLSYAGLGAAMARTALRTQQKQENYGSCSVEVLQGNKNWTVNMQSMESEAKVIKMAWAGYQEAIYLVRENITKSLNRSDVAPLPWIELTPKQLFFLRYAQMHCEKTSKIDLLAVKERGHIPGPIRVNKILMNNKKFREAFCPGQEKRVEDMCKRTH